MSAVLEALEPSARYLDAIEPKLVQQFDLLIGASAGVTRLRELILALAMQGKLVPQDPTDESAAQLVMRLIAERGESTLRRRMSTNTGVHPVGQASDSLPSSWAVASLSAISVKLTDGSHNPPRDAGSGIPMLSSQNVLESGAIDFDSPTRYVSIDDFERENTRTNATPGDVLLTIVASLGRSAVVPVDAPAFVLQRSVAVIRTGLVPSFLAIFLRSPAARAYYDQHGKGTAQKGIYLGKLGELTLPIPPLAEQARIVARVDELMRLCDALEAKGRLEAEQHGRLLGTLLGMLTDSSTPEELAANWQRVAEHFDLLLDRPEAVDVLEQTVLQLAVRGLLVERDQYGPPECPAEGAVRSAVPYGWTRRQFGDVVNMLNGYAFKSDWFRASGIRLVRNVNVSHGQLDWSQSAFVSTDLAEEFSQFYLTAGDVVLSLDRPIISTGLKLAVIRTIDLPCLLLQRVARLTPDPKALSTRYMELWLSSDRFLNTIDPGRSNGVPHISTKQVAALEIDLPPVDEQARIVARVTELRRFCADLRQRLAASQATQSRLAEALVEAATA